MGGSVFQVFIQRGQAAAAGFAVPMRYDEAGGHGAAALAHFGTDAPDFEVHVYPIRHRAFEGVFADGVVVEEAAGVVAGRGSEADQEGVEIVQHLAPTAVDAPVAFVHDDEVEAFRRNVRVVGHRAFGVVGRGGEAAAFVGFLVDVDAPQGGVEALHGADHHGGRRVDGAALQVLDAEFLGEQQVGAGRLEVGEFADRLLAQVVAVHQEQHATGAHRRAEKAMRQGASGEGLAGAGGHTDQGARAAGGEGGFNAGYRLGLAGPEGCAVQGRHTG